MIRRHVEFVSFDELGAEISLIKGGPGKVTGGTPSGQSGGHLSPGGDCFAPLVPWWSRITRQETGDRRQETGDRRQKTGD